MNFLKDKKGRIFFEVGQTPEVGKVPALTTLFSCGDGVLIVLRSDDMKKHVENGLFVEFVPTVQNQAGV